MVPTNKSLPSPTKAPQQVYWTNDRLRSIDIRIWFLTFAVCVCLSDVSDLIASLPFAKLRVEIFAILSRFVFDVFLLYTALTNKILLLKINEFFMCLFTKILFGTFFLSSIATVCIVFGFQKIANYLPVLLEETNEKKTYREQVSDHLIATMMAGFYAFALLFRHYLVKKTLETVQNEQVLDSPIV